MQKFWQWYQNHYTLNLTVAAGLFTFQLVHLFWLTTHVVWQRLLGTPLFEPSGWITNLIILVDYTEIPALITTSLVFIHQLRERFSWKTVGYLAALNIQLVHIFWITDEFVLDAWTGASVAIPVWLAWIAILIDYLEIPVIIETIRLLVKQLAKGNMRGAMESLKEK